MEPMHKIILSVMTNLNTENSKNKSENNTEPQEIENKDVHTLENQCFSMRFIKNILEISMKHLKKILLECIQNRICKINQKLHTSNIVKLRDKFVFAFSLFNIFLGVFILGKMPCHFHLYYIFNFSILMLVRVIANIMVRYHYLFLDFCYFVNLVTLTYLTIYPDSQVLFNIAFSFASGPVLIAVLYFKNSLVLHSIEIMINLAMHIFPPLTLWSIKTSECSQFKASLVHMSLYDFITNSTLVYLAWSLLYSFIIFYLTYESNIRKGNMTLYKLVLDRDPQFNKLCSIFGDRFRPLIFMAVHASYSISHIFFAYFLLTNQWAFTTVLLIILFCGVYNGASYYFDFFSERYQSNLKKIEELYLNLA